MSEDRVKPTWLPIHDAEEKHDAETRRQLGIPPLPEGMTPDIPPPWNRHPGTIAELDEAYGPPLSVTNCWPLPPERGRHRAPTVGGMRPRRAKRLAIAAIAVAAVVLVLALGALWASHQARAEPFTVCPSGMTGVSTPDTSCGFAEGVRAAFYTQTGWTVVAYSPVTSKFYTMFCRQAVTTESWYFPKRCSGVSDGGDPLIVYIA